MSHNSKSWSIKRKEADRQRISRSHLPKNKRKSGQQKSTESTNQIMENKFYRKVILNKIFKEY